MQIYRLVITAGQPITFNKLFHSLMAKEANVQPMPRLEEGFGSINVLVHLLDHFLAMSSFAIIVAASFLSGGKDTNKYRNYKSLDNFFAIFRDLAKDLMVNWLVNV